MSQEYQLPDKWSEEAVDENDNKLSKRQVRRMSEMSCQVTHQTKQISRLSLTLLYVASGRNAKRLSESRRKEPRRRYRGGD